MKKLIFSFVLLGSVFMTNSFAYGLNIEKEATIQNCAYSKQQKSFGRDALAIDIDKCIDQCIAIYEIYGFNAYHECLNYCKENGAF